jgi:hypothetical protein
VELLNNVAFNGRNVLNSANLEMFRLNVLDEMQMARTTRYNGHIVMSDAFDFGFGTTTGTRIGTASTQKLAFYGATAIVRPANTSDLRQLLIDLGLLATGGANPLNLNGGAFTAATGTFTGTLGVTGISSLNGGIRQSGIAGDIASPTAGDFWYDSTQKTHRFQSTVAKAGNVGLIYASTADDALASGGTAELKFASQIALAAAGLVVGKVIRVKIVGSITIDATASQTTTIRLKLGDATNATSGTLVASTVYTHTTNNITNMPWGLECLIHVRSATTVWAGGTAYFCAAATTPFTSVTQHLLNGGGVGTASTIPNISGAQTLHVTGQPNDTGQTITIRNMTVEILN